MLLARVGALSLVALIIGGHALAAGPGVTPSARPLGIDGARSLGDPFYPTLGNGGYDIEAYDLDLTWNVPDAARPQGWVAGAATIDLLPDQDLAQLSLDLTRDNTHVDSVTVDGAPVDYRPDALGRKLILTPAEPLVAGTQSRVVVTWTATPLGVHRLGEGLPLAGESGAEGARVTARGFLSDGNGGFFMASQPNGAHTLFPSNDYPTDKAPVTVHLTAPAGMLGVATGTRISQTANDDGTTTTTWRSEDPVATHVLALGVGRWSVLEDDPGPGPHERSSVPALLAPLASLRTDALDQTVSWLEDAVGRPYPFPTLGLQMVAPGSTAAILEGQTLILMGAGMLDPRVEDCAWQGLLIHETAHQWFGDSVSLERWDQKWLSEGHATFYQRLWETATGCDPLDLEARMHRIYAGAQAVRDAGGPPDRPRSARYLYESTIYDQGALALYALRQRVGARTFRAIETKWLDRYAGGSASTDDFIALASEVADRDLGGFLERWLRSDRVPSMPGHPDWVTSPLPSPTPQSTPATSPGT
jgi:aminopeptidase N